MGTLESLARSLTLGELLEALRVGWGGYEVLHHWTQGEFHHDLVLRVARPRGLGAEVLVVATNCNGGVKELLVLSGAPSRDALWRWRCPDAEFAPDPLPEVLATARTCHWFDACELLGPDARSELRPEHRVRQRGGGWERKR